MKLNYYNLITILIVSFLSACTSSSRLSTNSTKSYTSIFERDIKGTLNNEQKQEIAMMSFSVLNVKYNWGGKKPDFGIDCSGLVTYVYKNSINFDIKGAAHQMVKIGKSVPVSHATKGKLQLGDLIFFNTTGKSYSHVGIYLGEGKFLHASSGKQQVIISKISNNYFNSRIDAIQRI